MTFLYPLGLLGLIGIPVLIIIYIIKSKYSEQTVASTYIWRLSERFLKRKKPVSRLTGIISLILQILVVAAASFIVAHPVLILENAAHDYCFVLDASGSMNAKQGGKTRFELGKDEISSIVQDAAEGSTYSLIYVGDATIAFDVTDDKEETLNVLSELQPAYVNVDFADALGVAQGYFDDNPSTLTYLVTDKLYENSENIEIIRVFDEQENYALTNVSYALDDTALTVNADAVSYVSAANLTVELYVDDNAQAAATKTVSVQKNVPQSVQLTSEISSFNRLTLKIKETDGLDLDNEVVLFSVEKENEYKVLLVSENPIYLQSALKNIGNAALTVFSEEEYTGQTGFDLYVFDCVSPAEMPQDGAVWLFNLTESLPKSGFSVQGFVNLEEQGGGRLELTRGGSTVEKTLTKNMSGNGIYVSKYVKYGFSGNFTTLLHYKSNPIVFTGTNEYGNREVVFAFDLHDSNFPMLLDYLYLTGNLWEYSFPTVVEDVFYHSGEEAMVNIIAGCKSVRIDSPLGNVSYLDTSSATSTFTLTEVGVYTVTMTVGETPRVFHVYSALAEEERNPLQTEKTVGLNGEAENGMRDGKYDKLIILFALLAVLFVADWVVYCYDRYQLR